MRQETEGLKAIDQKALAGLLADLGNAITNLSATHQYWSMRVIGGDGKVRIEYTFSDSPYTIQPKATGGHK